MKKYVKKTQNDVGVFRQLESRPPVHLHLQSSVNSNSLANVLEADRMKATNCDIQSKFVNAEAGKNTSLDTSISRLLFHSDHYMYRMYFQTSKCIHTRSLGSKSSWGTSKEQALRQAFAISDSVFGSTEAAERGGGGSGEGRGEW